MSALKAIQSLKAMQWKALILLTVFAANLYAVCHCHHRAMSKPVAISCCAAKHTQSDDPDCPNKNGCQNDRSIKFSLLDKQTVEKISLNPVYIPAVVITAPQTQLTTRPTPVAGWPEWKYKHAPPDWQSLYQRFLI